MSSGTDQLAQTRFENAIVLFEEFVRSNVKHADAATLRGLEGRFALRLQIQPSYWSQIKARSRQIGERLARQFERLSRKPPGWMDVPHAAGQASASPTSNSTRRALLPFEQSASSEGESFGIPLDDDERFIVGLVLTYYRRHPQRARTRLLELLGEVLTPGLPSPGPSTTGTTQATRARPSSPSGQAWSSDLTESEAGALWASSQAGVAPLKQKR